MESTSLSSDLFSTFHQSDHQLSRSDIFSILNDCSVSDTLSDFSSDSRSSFERMNEYLHELDEEIYERKRQLPPPINILLPLERRKSIFTNDLGQYLVEKLGIWKGKLTLYELTDEIHDENYCLGYACRHDKRLDVYRDFVKILNSSKFPFSLKQKSIKYVLEVKTRTLDLYAKNYDEKIFPRYQAKELEIKSAYDSFVDLLAKTEYESVSMTLINRYILELMSELQFWVIKSNGKPLFKPDNVSFFSDPAAYLIFKLKQAFPDSTEESFEQLYFAKRKETHLKLIRILQTTKFPFTSSQKGFIQQLSEKIIFTNGNPDSEEELKFVSILETLLYDLNFIDKGVRFGISNLKKIQRALEKLIDELIDLGKLERKLISEFQKFSFHSPDLVNSVIHTLATSFIPRHALELSLDTYEEFIEKSPLCDFLNFDFF